MKVNDYASIIEKIAPRESAMDYDNVGLLVGCAENEVTGVLITVDVTSAALDEAIENNCNLIISHHPIIFNALTSFLTDDYKNAIITKAFVNNISIYAAHTNVDRMPENMAYWTARKLNCNNINSLSTDGIGIIAETENPLKISELVEKLKVITGETIVKTVGNVNKKVYKLAFVNGAGGDSDLLNIAKNKCADVYISSEFKHHNMLEALESGLNLIEISHYASEKCFVDILNDIIKHHTDTKIIKYYVRNPHN